ncbi:SAM-dependent methyltransferase [Vibrio sp. JC009]|uniref:methyltransferase n=1 Tax=Vibrio sp. JC009 TaxID=2912314 RepID=UPI0023B1AB6E|nr:methyltransferase [Vibrio sp. JC009]WED22712.1 SAM-dependent methyltransferase [Vibrio sp. JC009]
MQSRFHQLDALLTKHQTLWRFEPFQLSGQRDLIEKRFPSDLCRWLDALSIEDTIRFKSDSHALAENLVSVIPDVKSLEALCELPDETQINLDLPRGLESGIPGRKVAQIVSISNYVLAHHKSPEWLEWCSGKGYLGRILAQQSGQPVTSLEWQESLCEAGQKEADSRKLPMKFVQGDAFSDQAKQLFQQKQHAVALHACGDLHVQLIKNAVEKHLSEVTFSPCCYHLIRDENYQPLSEAAKSSKLTLSKNELRIPLQETVTGGERVKKHRQSEMSYRLGLDLLLKAETEHKEYITIPSIKKSELANGFEYFCRWAADKKGFSLPDTDFGFWFSKGEERFWQMEKLSLIQQIFRRPLEMWLVLDRGIYLEENGYWVEMSAFCDRGVTPRNILIHGALGD